MNFARDIVEAAPADARALIEIDRAGARREWSFGEVAQRTGALAARFAALGVRRGDVVLTLGAGSVWTLGEELLRRRQA